MIRKPVPESTIAVVERHTGSEVRQGDLEYYEQEEDKVITFKLVLLGKNRHNRNIGFQTFKHEMFEITALDRFNVHVEKELKRLQVGRIDTKTIMTHFEHLKNS